MDNNQPIAALFDLDGVIVDTESQYTLFWHRQGEAYRPDMPHFEQRIKGMTLTQILEFFADQPGIPERIQEELNQFETRMDYTYIPGATDFIRALRTQDIRTAVVTSSNTKKMENVYRAHPEFTSLFDRIFTAEDFQHSKPDPDCYLLGARVFGTVPERCFVFEDSFNGLLAGRRAGMTVIGLSTTNPEAASATWQTWSSPTSQASALKRCTHSYGNDTKSITLHPLYKKLLHIYLTKRLKNHVRLYLQ